VLLVVHIFQLINQIWKSPLASTIFGWFSMVYYYTRENRKNALGTSSRATNFILREWCEHVLLIICQQMGSNGLYSKPTLSKPWDGILLSIFFFEGKQLWILKCPTFILYSLSFVKCLSTFPGIFSFPSLHPIHWKVLSAKDWTIKRVSCTLCIRWTGAGDFTQIISLI
jgi:hypothetical protein